MSLSQLRANADSEQERRRNMNGALLGLAVVVAIGLVLSAVLFVGGKLIEATPTPRRAFSLERRHAPCTRLELGDHRNDLRSIMEEA
ncbi:MAG: hypothetical protein DME65_03475 [Verrucomicrobia bacterium]|nr:MAG: hypothetical protein DME65_03475 [Verrucomicrobiota bacterium]